MTRDVSAPLDMTKRNSSPRHAKMRLDQMLVAGEFYQTREQARRAIMAGEVRLKDQVANKASLMVATGAHIVIAQPPRFVGRGGLKLEGALDYFRIDANGVVAADIGASTGGFTDCLLQRGATRVYAIDVGHGQLDWKIRKDSRVAVLEKTNARHLPLSLFPGPLDLCVIDVSFISLTLILPSAFAALRPSGTVLALIKPQFELSRAEVARGGIVRDAALHDKAREKIRSFILNLDHEVVGTAPSVITGTDGNQEFFVCARKQSA